MKFLFPDTIGIAVYCPTMKEIICVCVDRRIICFIDWKTGVKFERIVDGRYKTQ